VHAPFAAAVLGVGLALTACQTQLEPEQVSRRFWKAVQAQDAGAIRLFATRSSHAAIEAAPPLLSIGETRLGRTVVDGDAATVEATVTVLGDPPMQLPLLTRLAREDGHWKVDYQRTVQPLATGGQLAALIERLREFNTRFSGEVDRSLDDLEAALPEIERELRRLEASIEGKIPELKRRIEQFAKELEEALEDPREKRSADQPIAI
jgi:hypothetical protein